MKASVMRDGQRVSVDVYKKQGVLLRKGTYDEYVLREVQKSYSELRLEGSRVLDIGANIGLFSNLVVREGASLVVSVEPDISNFHLLERNCPEAVTYNAAAVSDALSVPEIELWYSTTGKNPGNTSTTHFRGRTSVSVQTVGFHSLIMEHGIDTIKMDCEGAEFDLLSDRLPDSVRQIALEIHLSKREWREDLADNLVESFAEWECTRTPTIGEKNWTTLGAWKR